MKTIRTLAGLYILVAGMFFFPVDRALAVTANPAPIQYTQPDGSAITIQLKGDESIHWAETSDGYTILSDSKGFYEYATLDRTGRMTFSGIVARNPEARSAAERTWLEGTGKGLFFSRSQVEEMKRVLVRGGETDAPLMGGFPTTGTRKLLMILANFNNTTTTYPQTNFSNYMNQVNYNGTGSFRDFYLEVSYGQLTVNTTVTVWVTVPNTHDYYGPESKWGEFAYDAVVAAHNQASVNFAEFDNNLDGVVDGVAIIHQGQGQEDEGEGGVPQGGACGDPAVPGGPRQVRARELRPLLCPAAPGQGKEDELGHDAVREGKEEGKAVDPGHVDDLEDGKEEGLGLGKEAPGITEEAR